MPCLNHDCGGYSYFSGDRQTTDKRRKAGMRWLILGAALSAVTTPALAAEFMLNSPPTMSLRKYAPGAGARSWSGPT